MSVVQKIQLNKVRSEENLTCPKWENLFQIQKPSDPKGFLKGVIENRSEW
jgi:hypothetical protein